MYSEQKCTIGSIARFGLNSVPGSCSGGTLNALTGKQSCVLDCADGYIKTDGGEITCGPNKDEAEGKLSGEITCKGETFVMGTPHDFFFQS